MAKCKRCGEHTATHCVSCLADCMDEREQGRDQLAEWILTLEKCRINLPPSAHPAHRENLAEMIHYFRWQLKKEE